MSPPGRPKGEYRSAKREGSPVSTLVHARTAALPAQAAAGASMPARRHWARDLWRLLAPLYRQRAGALAAAFALAGVTLAAGVGLLGVSGWFLTGAALTTAGMAFNLFAPSALVRGLSFLRIAARYGERVTGHGATLRLLADLRTVVFGKLLPLDLAQLSRYRDGDLVARLTGDVDALDSVFLLVLVPIACALLGGAALGVVLGLWLPAAAWTLAVSVGASALLVPWWLAQASRAPGAAAQQAAAELRSQALQAVEGHADLLALDAEGAARREFAQACTALSRARQRQANLGTAGQAALQAVAGACVLAVLAWGLPALRNGTLPGPVLVGLLLAVLGFFEVVGPLMRGASRLGGAASAGARVAELAALSPAVRDPETPAPPPADMTLQVEAVDYAYAPGARPVLRDVSLRVAPGECIALVGESGAGKSTLLSLLLRLADPTAGRVTLGGVDLRALRQQDLHARVTLLSQDAPVFLGTVRTNLLIGAPEAGEAALWEAVDAAGLGAFVRGLPDGLDTWTGETGRSLSAGQARRLCLARALLSPARILVLDEPTQGLDAETERAFLTDLPRAARGRSVVLSTHASLPPGVMHRVLRVESGRLLPVAGPV